MEALKSDLQVSAALKIAGDAAAEQGDVRSRAGLLRPDPGDGSPQPVPGMLWCRTVLVIGKSQLSAAEAKFREALSLQPNNYQALDGLSFLLAMTGRRWESAPFYLRLLQNGHFQTGHLLGIGVLEYQLSEPSRAAGMSAGGTAGSLTRTGVGATGLAGEQRRIEALRAASSRRGVSPGTGGSAGAVRAICCSTADELEGPGEMACAAAGLADEHPEIWVVRARWAQQTEDPRGAVRCYLEALRRDPNHQLAASQISVVLFSLGENALAQQFARRSQQLLRFHEVIFQLRKQPNNPTVRAAQAAQRAEAQEPSVGSGGLVRAAADARASSRNGRNDALARTHSAADPQHTADAAGKQPGFARALWIRGRCLTGSQRHRQDPAPTGRRPWTCPCNSKISRRPRDSTSSYFNGRDPNKAGLSDVRSGRRRHRHPRLRLRRLAGHLPDPGLSLAARSTTRPSSTTNCFATWVTDALKMSRSRPACAKTVLAKDWRSATWTTTDFPISTSPTSAGTALPQPWRRHVRGHHGARPD